MPARCIVHLQRSVICIIIALKGQTAGVASTGTLRTGQSCSNQTLVEVIAELKTVYSGLSEDALLTSYLDGKTQNQNESLNGMIWAQVPKEVFVGAYVLHLGVFNAVSHFSIGSQAAFLSINH